MLPIHGHGELGLEGDVEGQGGGMNEKRRQERQGVYESLKVLSNWCKLARAAQLSPNEGPRN